MPSDYDYMTPTVTSGEGSAAQFVAASEALLREELGFTPFHGTLNLTGNDDLPPLSEFIPLEDNEHCKGIRYTRCYVSGIRASVIRPIVSRYPAEKYELVAPIKLRDLFSIDDGECLAIAERPWEPDGKRTTIDRLSEFNAIVFDFDGTLVELEVDWTSVRDEIENVLDPYIDRPVGEYDEAQLFNLARQYGVYDEIDDIITSHEVENIEETPVLDVLKRIHEIECPLGVCTTNATTAVDRILAHTGLEDQFNSIIGRDTVSESKPNPRPLTRCLDELNANSGNSLFVGDQPSDALTAHRAGTSFLHPKQLIVDD